MQQVSPVEFIHRLWQFLAKTLNYQLRYNNYGSRTDICLFEGVMSLLFHVINSEWIGTVITV